MKITTFISIFTLLLIIGCKKPLLNPDNSHQDDCWTPPISLPENDGVVYNLAFMKNDTLWTATETTNGIVDLTLSGVPININYSIFQEGNSLSVRGDLNINDECQEIFSRIYFYVVNPSEGVNDSIGISTGFDDYTNNLGYEIDFNSPRQVILTKLDLENERAEGTFEFNLIDEENQDTLHIRDGRFEEILKDTKYALLA